MTTKIVTTAILSGMVLLSLGCGKSASETNEQAQNKITADGNPALQNATYASTCGSSTIPDIGPIKFPGMQTFFELSDLSFTKHVVYYSDTDCKTVAFEIRENGNLHVAGKSQFVAGALDEDFNYMHTTVNIENDTVLAAFNAATVCGINDWAKGTPRDTSTQSANGLCPGKASPRKTADTVLVSNNQLMLGADADQDATTARPTKVDSSRVYTKQ